MTLLAFDPGTMRSGWAFFSDDDELVEAGVVRASGVVEMIRALGGIGICPNTFVVEVPQIYTAAKSKGDPNDLVAVALVAGAAIERFGARARAGVVKAKPRDWKGTTPKEINHTRTRAKLSPDELSVVQSAALRAGKTASLDLLDAVGIGLWALRR